MSEARYVAMSDVERERPFGLTDDQAGPSYMRRYTKSLHNHAFQTLDVYAYATKDKRLRIVAFVFQHTRAGICGDDPQDSAFWDGPMVTFTEGEPYPTKLHARRAARRLMQSLDQTFLDKLHTEVLA